VTIKERRDAMPQGRPGALPLLRAYLALSLGLALFCAMICPSASLARPRAAPRTVATSEAVICRRIRAVDGARHLAGGRRRLTILATGDSMIYPIEEELALNAPRGVRVVEDRHDGTGLTTNTVDWKRLSARQAAGVKPDVTVISLGGRDGGIPLPDSSHRLIPCCGAEWLALYAARVRPLVEAYLRGGRGRVYWLLLPAPREALRAPLFEAVNDALRLLAREVGGAMRLIPVDSTVAPGGYTEAIEYDGMRFNPRAPDGIHLNHAGACVEDSLVNAALREEGILR